MLAPNLNAVETALTANVNMVNSITAGEQAIETLTLPPASVFKDPPGSWYTTLTTSLGTAQANAKNWVQQVGPAMFAGVPQAFIQAATNVSTPLASIAKILQTSSNQPSSTQMSQVGEYLSLAASAVQAGVQSLSAFQAQVTAQKKLLVQDRDSLAQGVEAAESALVADATTCFQLQSQLTTLMVGLVRASDQLTSDQVDSRTEVARLLLTFGVKGGAKGGKAGWAGVVAASVVGVIKITKDNVEAFQLKKVVKTDFKNVQNTIISVQESVLQVSALKWLIGSLENVLFQNFTLPSALPELGLLLAGVGLEIAGVQAALAQPTVDVTKIPNLQSIAAANQTWTDITSFAENAQGTPVTTQTQSLNDAG